MTPAEARAIRLAMGMSQKQMAEALGVRRESVSELENGKRPIATVYELAYAALRCRHAAKALEGAEIEHLDGDPHNNDPANLRLRKIAKEQQT